MRSVRHWGLRAIRGMRPPTKKRRALKERASGTTSVLLATALGLLALAPAAHAAAPAPYDYAYPGGSLPSGETGAAMGLTYTDSGSQGSVFNASLGSMWIKDPATGGPLRTFCALYGTAFKSSGPWTETSVTSQAAARVAWAISAAAGQSPAGDAAVQDLIHVFFENTQDPVLKILHATPSGMATLAEAQKIWEASAPYTGSYSTSPAVETGAPGTGKVVNTQVRSATGTISVPITLTISGNAVFDATGTNTYSGSAGDAPSFHVVDGGGRIVISETTAPIASSLRLFSSAGNQTQLAAGAATAVSGSTEGTEIWGHFQPRATSTAPTYFAPGSRLSDTLHVTTATGGGDWIPGVSARFDVDWLYYPTKQEPSADAPAGGTPVGAGWAAASGPGDLSVSGPTADKPGYYYPVASFAKANQTPDRQRYFTGDWTGGFSDPGEESMVKYTPSVVTKTSEISDDGKISDTLTVTGSYPGQTLSVVAKLILTSECTPGDGLVEAPADAQTIGTVVTLATGDGSVTTEAVAVPWAKIVDLWAAGKPSCLTWQESIAATETTEAWSGRYLVAAETVLLDKPTIRTQASGNGTVPLDAHDTGTVTGTIPTGPGVQTLTKVDQYKFDDSTNGSAQPVCLKPSYSSDWLTIAPGATAIAYPTHRIEHAGTYGYVETLKVTVDGKDTTLHTGRCGAEGETVIATAPGQPMAPAALTPPLVNAGNIPPAAGPVGGPLTRLLIGGTAALVLGGSILGTALIRRPRRPRDGKI